MKNHKPDNMNLLHRILRKGIVALYIAIILTLAALLVSYSNYSRSSLLGDFVPLDQGSIEMPDDEAADEPMERGNLGGEIIAKWADKNLDPYVTGIIPPRIMMAKLLEGKDVDGVNRIIMTLRPRGNSGSTWLLHPDGDYDFIEIYLITLVFLFEKRPDRLYPVSVWHIMGNLILEEGGAPRLTVPRSLGLVKETENHVLMTETVRYLKNQWLRDHGSLDPSHDNGRNGLGKWLLRKLLRLWEAGFYEFNSMPYSGYSLSALLVLEAFAGDREVSFLARRILDRTNWHYALGSLDFRRYPPFRRRYDYASATLMGRDYHTLMMRVWTGDAAGIPLRELIKNPHAMFSALMPYRLPGGTAAWVRKKPCPYFVKIGHGYNSSPELYSGGPGYLVSAGGVNRGIYSGIVARPVVLLLSDGSKDFRDCFYIPGRGPFFDWNNTGVHKDFACGNAPVSVPEKYRPVAEEGHWRVYRPFRDRNLFIATFSARRLGIIAVFPGFMGNPESLAVELHRRNADPARLKERFVRPDGNIVGYNTEAPKNLWVIKSYNGARLDRDFDSWPVLEGEVPVR